MCLLLETIKLEDGELKNLFYHQQRFDQARKHFFQSTEISLKDHIQIPDFAKTGLFRCRISFQKNIKQIEFIPYHYREIKSLKIVHDDSIHYNFKYADRKQLQALFNTRGNCDDIIIIKNNEVTDSFAGNLLFGDGKNWLTPKNPLLKGTQRQKLLDTQKIHEAIILEQDILSFEKIGIINAFYDLGNLAVVKNTNIQFS